ncbi:TPA: hypothetical protein DCQ44_02240, partial [Candidatus Taylorbacteria bacterium]|nr:hypothetical protein [Candidatus Taylorbacteria bacterium]
YSTPLDEATISWIVGGKVINKAFGLTDFSTIAGKVGSKSTIIARVVTANGSAIDKTIIIQPADVDLLWQASSYVPPFYQGKALYPHQGVIIFTAVPSVSASKSIVSSANSYVYTWKKDGDTLGDYSGFGKNTFALQGTIISRPFTIEVSISSTDGVSLGAASVTINPRSPQIAFYENNPLLGVLYNKNISSFTMQGKELSVTAVPFFFNTQPAGNLQFAWTMNNSPIASQSDPSALTVRNTTDAKGSATVGVQISNVIKTLQFAGRSMSVTFGDNQTSI